MNQFTTDALKFLHEKWGYILEGAAGADLIGVNRATMRTRIAKGQAMAMRDTEGRERGRVEYTPDHLVYNMLYDGLARFNAVPDGEKGEHWISSVVNGIYSDIGAGSFNPDMVVRAVRRDGVVSIHLFNDFDELDNFTGEPSVIVPIGTMVVRFAVTLMARHGSKA